MTTTITPAQLAAARDAADDATLRAIADAWDVTLPVPEPPEAMWALAEQIAYNAGDNLTPREYALAALQHADAALDNPALRGLSFDAAKPMLKTALGAA